jgi:hypothetical protein
MIARLDESPVTLRSVNTSLADMGVGASARAQRGHGSVRATAATSSRASYAGALSDPVPDGALGRAHLAAAES